MRIYVGILPHDVIGKTLSAAFAGHGEVDSAQMITDRYTGQYRGFGFVEMRDNAQAEAAIQGLNGSDLGDRIIKVNQARPRNDNRGGGGDRGPRR